MKFAQIIEFQTTKFDEIDELDAKWRAATEGRRTTVRQLKALDRDRPNTYVFIVEFDSYADAMKNSDLPETSEIAAAMTKVSDGTAVFRNVDILEEVAG